MRLPFEIWSDLPGRARGDCWWLVAEVFRRRGVGLVGFAADRFDDWREVADPEPGDVLSLGTHVGVVLGDGEYLHANYGALVTVGRIRTLDRAGRRPRYFRHAGTQPVSVDPTPAAGTVRVVYIPDPIGRPTERQTWFREPGTLGALAPAGATVVMTATGPRRIAEVADRPAPDVAVYATAPEGTELLIGIALALASAALSIILAPSVPSADRDEASPTFDLDGIRNTAASGVVQPVVYGEHKVGGNYISAVQRVDADGKAVFYGLILLSRGPIQSIAGLTADADDLSGPDIPDAVEIDGNPARNYDARVSVRLGGSNQTTVPGFAETATTNTLNAAVDQPSPPANWGNAQPFGYQTQTDVHGFDVLLTYPGGLVGYSTGNGNPYSMTMSYTVRWRPVGTTTWTSETWTHAGQRNAQVSYQFTKRGLARDRYEIQIQFLSAVTPGGNAQGGSDTLYAANVLAINEIVADGFSYPGCALLGVRLVGSDQLGGALPTITTTVEGRKVWIWDGVSETAPAFAQTYTRNPAWIILDMLTSRDYGLGRGGRFTLDNVSLADFEYFADWCDESVDDGRGGTVPRAYCDHPADAERGGWDLAVEIAAAAFGKLYFAGGKARIWIDRAASPVFMFTAGNSREVRAHYNGRRSRPNAADVQYLNGETDYERDYAVKLDDSAVLASGAAITKQSINAVGVTRAAQAYRLAQRTINAARYVGRRFEWIGGPESIHLQPGDVVYLHGSALGAGIGGRVLSATSSTVKLDRTLTAAARVRLIVTKQDDTTETVYVAAGTYARDSAISIVDSGGTPTTWTGTPAAASKWVVASLSSQSVEPVQVRIERVAVNESLDAAFEGSEYVADVYSDDPGDVEEFTDQLPDPRTMPASVEGLRVTDAAHVSADGTVADALRVSFTTDEAWQAAEVWYRAAGGGAWTFAGWSRGDLLIPVGGGTTWEVAVSARSASGTRQRIEDAARASCHVRGRRAPPTAPTSVCASVTAGGILGVRIVPPTDDPTVAGYQIRYGSTWAGSVLVAALAPADWSGACPFTGSETLRVRSVSRTGVTSSTEVAVLVEWTPAPSVFTADLDADQNPGWAGDLDDAVVTGTEVQIDGSNLSGTYTVDLLAPADTAAVEQVVVTARCGLADVAMTWDEAGFTWGGALASSLTWATAYLSGREVTELDAPTWAQAGWTWDGLQSSLRTWAGPTDVVAALTPDVHYDIDEALTWPDACPPPVVDGIDTVAARVTLHRPHTRYDPRLMTMNLATFDLSDAGGGGSGGPWDLGSVTDAVDGIFDFGSV